MDWFKVHKNEAEAVICKNITIAVLAAACLLPYPVKAEEPPGGFTFKRVTPLPSTGAKRLISIQVEPPKEVKRVLDHVIDLPDEEEKPVPKPVYAQSDDWFWANVSPDLRDRGFGKLVLAGAVLAGAPDQAKPLFPSSQRLRKIVDAYGVDILKATSGTQVSPALVVAVISTESAGNPEAVSKAGAAGLMQLMPATAKRFGVEKRTDPAQNIAGGVKYLDFLLDRFDGDAVLALAAYNAGEGAVDRNGGVPNYKETRGYVPKVVAAWERARMMCMIPPVRATDGCLFAGLKIASQ
ncbi:lytic transglycosylase domain-containing protein [Halovulum sp. GXIMD14793]